MNSDEYRLDELARLSGVSARNIRAYRERGLLDPPRREGRSAFYDGFHLTQLQTINELLGRGFTSAHVAEFFETMRAGGSVAELLGLRRAILRPRTDLGNPTPDADRDGTGEARLRLALLDASRDTVQALADDVMAVLERVAITRYGATVRAPDDLWDIGRWIADSVEFSHDVVSDGLKRALHSRLAAAAPEGRAAPTAD